jgi:hypothetical protein
MKNRVPVKKEDRPPLPSFDPVPRKKQRHDGWTPARQKAFIEALADTGSVSRAAAMVNMTARCAYYLRRQPGAEGFRKAWEAALDFGVARMKDIAFERAISGYLVPMFVGGKLIGWRRKYNDRLLMFCLRHYGEDADGKRTKIEYFSTRASAGSAGSNEKEEGGSRIQSGMTSGSVAEASTTTVRTVISGKSGTRELDPAGETLETFEGVELDEEAKAEIARALAECAARRREVAGTPDDEDEPFVAALPPPQPIGDLWKPGDKIERELPVYDVAAAPEEMVEITPKDGIEPEEQYRSGEAEAPWEMLDDEEGMRAVEEAVESVKASQRDCPGDRRDRSLGKGRK